MANGQKPNHTNQPGGQKGKEGKDHPRMTASKRAALLASAMHSDEGDKPDADEVFFEKEMTQTEFAEA